MTSWTTWMHHVILPDERMPHCRAEHIIALPEEY